MGLFKKIEKFEQKWNGNAANLNDTSNPHVNGKQNASNGASVHAHANHEVSRQQPGPAMRNDDKRLPNPNVPRIRSNEPTSALTKTAPAFPRRPVSMTQDVEAETRPNMQRMATARSMKEHSHDVPMELLKEPPQLDTILPGPLVRKETALDTGSVHDELIRNLAVVRDREKELEDAMEEKTTKIKEQEMDIQGLLRSQNECVLQIENLTMQLREEREQNAKLTQAWKRSTAALNQAQRQEANYKVDDKALQALYQELVFNVANWADTYCIPDMKHLSDSDFEPFQSLTVAPNKYLRHKRTQPLLLKSLVMRMLVNVIFGVSRDTGLWWAGNRSTEMRPVYAALLPAEPYDIPGLLKKGALRSGDIKEFSQWKAKSALLLSQRVEPSVMAANVDMLVREWKPTLTPFVERNEAGVWRDLEDVIHKAIDLDLEMNKSRALFAVHNWSAGGLEMLDQTKIEAAVGFEAAHPGMTVELVLAPSLTKTGNSDGDAFEISSFISKWIVVCTENRENMKKIPKVGSGR